MNATDEAIVAIVAYLIVAAVLSFITSLGGKETIGATKTEKKSEAESQAQISKPLKKSKLIKDGYEALCNPCKRTFETDTYLKNHLEGQKHIKKSQNYQGDIYTIRKISKK
jgi:Zinc-finger of C2H2 type